MSQENVEILRRFYPGSSVDVAKVLADEDEFARYEEPLLPLIHQNFETVTDPSFAGMGGAGSNRALGIDGFREISLCVSMPSAMQSLHPI
jgi:hypothetical protein